MSALEKMSHVELQDKILKEWYGASLDILNPERLKNPLTMRTDMRAEQRLYDAYRIAFEAVAGQNPNENLLRSPKILQIIDAALKKQKDLSERDRNCLIEGYKKIVTILEKKPAPALVVS